MLHPSFRYTGLCYTSSLLHEVTLQPVHCYTGPCYTPVFATLGFATSRSALHKILPQPVHCYTGSPLPTSRFCYMRSHYNPFHRIISFHILNAFHSPSFRLPPNIMGVPGFHRTRRQPPYKMGVAPHLRPSSANRKGVSSRGAILAPRPSSLLQSTNIPHRPCPICPCNLCDRSAKSKAKTYITVSPMGPVFH